MATLAELTVMISGNTASLSAALGRADKQVSGFASGFGSKMGKAFGDVSKIAGGFVMAQGFLKAPGLFMDAAQAAADDAASVAKLQQAVENSGAAWSTYAAQLGTVIEGAQKRGFTDDQARDSLSLLTAQTGSAEEAAKRFALAQDLARGANIDVVTASKLLGKVTEDNVNVLGRYGIAATEGMGETELFGMIQAKFGGQAETFAKSTAGQMEAAKCSPALSFHEAVDLYLLGLQTAGRSRYTVKGRRCALSTLKDFAKSDDLRAVTGAIPAFLSSQFAVLDHNSATLKWQLIRHFCAFCLKKGWLKDNLFDDLPVPRMRRKVVRPLTDAQLHRLFEVADVWDKAILTILLSTGMRVSELTALCWSDIDGYTLLIHGKGGKERLVSVSVAGSRVLAGLPRNGHHVFPFQTSSIQDRFQRLSKRSGIHVHAHLLRHSCADRLRQVGVGIEDIGVILGHSDLSTTMRYLGRESERALEAQRAHNPCDAFWQGPPTPSPATPAVGGYGNIIPFRARATG